MCTRSLLIIFFVTFCRHARKVWSELDCLVALFPFLSSHCRNDWIRPYNSITYFDITVLLVLYWWYCVCNVDWRFCVFTAVCVCVVCTGKPPAYAEEADGIGACILTTYVIFHQRFDFPFQKISMLLKWYKSTRTNSRESYKIKCSFLLWIFY